MRNNDHWLKLLSILGVAALVGCAGPSHKSGVPVGTRPFGQIADGTVVDCYTLCNRNGAEARIITYGGLVISLKVPDRNGQMGDVVLGYDKLEGYLQDTPYFGALIGRYGNRIAKGKFTLDGQQYTLVTNNFPNALHGVSRDSTRLSGRLKFLFRGPARHWSSNTRARMAKKAIRAIFRSPQSIRSLMTTRCDWITPPRPTRPRS